MIMHWSAIGILVVAAITPGPNNILVMNAGMRGGARAAIPLIAGMSQQQIAPWLRKAECRRRQPALPPSSC